MTGSAWLSARQNRDGGWGYGGGSSAVEPTAWALLALRGAGGASSEVFVRGAAWLSNLQRSDGGWPPRPTVAQSTWVTSVVLLLSGSAVRDASVASAASWLLGQTGRESSWIERLRTMLIGARNDVDVTAEGWPWFPGAAAWVVPTSVAVLALQKVQSFHPNPGIADRIRAGQDFLLRRRCADDGWNHGASKALGYDAGSYPETTGIALLALRGVPAGKLGRSFETAGRHLAATRSREAGSWLELGLAAHGRPVSRRQFGEPRTVLDAAVSNLSEQALEGKPFWMG